MDAEAFDVRDVGECGMRREGSAVAIEEPAPLGGGDGKERCAGHGEELVAAIFGKGNEGDARERGRGRVPIGEAVGADIGVGEGPEKLTLFIPDDTVAGGELGAPELAAGLGEVEEDKGVAFVFAGIARGGDGDAVAREKIGGVGVGGATVEEHTIDDAVDERDAAGGGGDEDAAAAVDGFALVGRTEERVIVAREIGAAGGLPGVEFARRAIGLAGVEVEQVHAFATAGEEGARGRGRGRRGGGGERENDDGEEGGHPGADRGHFRQNDAGDGKAWRDAKCRASDPGGSARVYGAKPHAAF